ncbi:transporter [Streptomyces eurocidicus]|uniref:Putative MFS family arabinose efflux permease n=1 Tax=Streptomyces eurocidicus TaxID=66423 RepID=A0A2N8NR56_STREU|nr:MFS transporter [Streptomyces eurocidicus]MBB5117032.1 putative MFS family arabinose efflux permease [Streptomyces eurocidicus]MBF6052671.1 MFS transporter [Streptomyces eurocidicus]PNE31243.1 transporter [Streptomyces eurocidicus]
MVNVRQTTRVAGGRPAVAAVAAGTFSVVTTEMLPVGLLTPIGEDLGVSAGTAGLTMTVPGLVAAVAAPVVTRLAGRRDRRWVLVGLMGLLTVANLLSAAATDIGVLVALRVLVGVCIGGVWAIAAGLAVRLVPERRVGPATSLIFSGIAVASVLGVPAGTLAGAAGGWRTAFLAMGGVALAVTAALAALLPPLPSPEPADGGAGNVLGPLRTAPVRVGLLVVLLLVTGHFAGYTFVRPLLERVPGTDAGLISGLLVAYGAAGVAGNFLAGSAVPRRPRATLLLIAAALAVVMPALAVAGGGAMGATVLVVLWGLAYGGVSVATQNRLMAAVPPAPGAREGVSALFVSVFNLAISLGALVGGRVVDAGSVAGAAWVGGGLALLAAGVVGVGGRVR